MTTVRVPRRAPNRADAMPISGPAATDATVLTTSTPPACAGVSPIASVISGMPHSSVNVAWCISPTQWVKNPCQHTGWRSTMPSISRTVARGARFSLDDVPPPDPVRPSGSAGAGGTSAMAMAAAMPTRAMPEPSARNAAVHPSAWRSMRNGTAETN